MKRIIELSIFVITLLAFGLTAHAGKPVDNFGIPFGNGFPSGPHYNLNIIGKKGIFSCPPPTYVEGVQVYGNVIFIPRDQGDDPITILMESGKKGPKGAQDITELQVTDWCTESFPDYSESKGDSAILRLPQNDNGYAVYARITGKPGENGEPAATIVPAIPDWSQNTLK